MNVCGVYPKEDEASHLAAVIAGKLTKSGTFGIIAGYPSEPMEELLDQYEKDKLIGHTPPNSPSPRQTLLYTRVFTNAQGATCAVLVNSVISPVNATVTTLRWQLCYLTGCRVLFSVVLAFVSAKHVGAQIKHINESAK